LAEQPVAAAVPLVITQSIAGVSPGWLVTRPLPAPRVPLTIRMVNGPLRKRAAAVRLTVIDTWQVPLPVHALDQVLNAWPARGTGVSVTTVPRVNWALHPVVAATPAVMVQLIPAGLEVTTPLPLPPPPFTVSVLRTTIAASSGSVGSGVSPQA
jgi:hypothetical protein